MGGRTLRVNQRHLNTAALTGEDGTDGVQESGTVLGDDFQQGAGRRTFLVEAQAGFDLEPRRLSVGLEARFQQALKWSFADQDFDNRLLEALAFRGIQLQGVKAIFEIKAVNDDSGAIGESACLGDVHAPSVENAGQGREQAGAVEGHDGEFVLPDNAAYGELCRLAAKLLRHLEMQKHLFGRVRHEIALGQSIEKFQQLRTALG